MVVIASFGELRTDMNGSIWLMIIGVVYGKICRKNALLYHQILGVSAFPAHFPI